MSILSRALWREIRRRPAQFFSVALVIALGVGIFNASFDAFLNLTGSYEHMYRETRLAHVTAIGGPTDAVLAAGEQMPELAASTSRTVANVPFLPREGHTMLGRAVGMPASGHATVNDVLVACVVGGLKRYVTGRGEELRQLRVSMPINMRSRHEKLEMELDLDPADGKHEITITLLPSGTPED